MSLTITPHPVYPLPSREQAQADPTKVQAYLLERERRIALELSDPLRYGFEPESWKLARTLLDKKGSGPLELVILGGNRAAKTEFASKLVNETLTEKDNAEVWACQTTEDNSIQMQQPIVEKYLPPEFRELRKGRITNIQYTKKNGFSNGSFIFPNGSRCIFKNYAQDPRVIEGGECDLIWCDELVPLNWIQTLRYRIATRGGILLLTFTAIEGWSPTIREYLDGATTLEHAPAPLLGPTAKVPLVQQPARRNAKVIYFHTIWNPFGGYANLVKILEGAPKDEIRTRAYGVPTKAMVARFPKFNDDVHTFEAANLPTSGSRYHIIDPASGRNWFQTWVLVDARGRYFIYREWPCEGRDIPDIGDPGPWAEPDGKRADGKRGEAQKTFGWGLLRYKEEISRLEALEPDDKGEPRSEQIFGRWMDGRFGNTANQRNEQTVTLIEQCQEVGIDIYPAPIDNIDEGVQMINDRLDYDANKAFGLDNEPRLFISRDCKATIFALKVWTGADGKDGACKDPIDNLRYLCSLDLQDIEDMDPCTEVLSY